MNNKKYKNKKAKRVMWFSFLENVTFLRFANIVLIMTSLLLSSFLSYRGFSSGLFIVITVILIINFYTSLKGSKSLREISNFMSALYLTCFVSVIFFYFVFKLFFQ